jgi:hypothetical protein
MRKRAHPTRPSVTYNLPRTKTPHRETPPMSRSEAALPCVKVPRTSVRERSVKAQGEGNPTPLSTPMQEGQGRGGPRSCPHPTFFKKRGPCFYPYAYEGPQGHPPSPLRRAQQP